MNIWTYTNKILKKSLLLASAFIISESAFAAESGSEIADKLIQSITKEINDHNAQRDAQPILTILKHGISRLPKEILSENFVNSVTSAFKAIKKQNNNSDVPIYIFFKFTELLLKSPKIQLNESFIHSFFELINLSYKKFDGYVGNILKKIYKLPAEKLNNDFLTIVYALFNSLPNEMNDDEKLDSCETILEYTAEKSNQH